MVSPAKLANLANLVQNNLSQKYPGSFVVHGVAGAGQASFSPDTQFVVLPPQWEDLVVGQIVIFKNPAGGLVAGQLIRQAGDAWVVNGDSGANRVTHENLVGQVVASFFPPGGIPDFRNGTDAVVIKQ